MHSAGNLRLCGWGKQKLGLGDQGTKWKCIAKIPSVLFTRYMALNFEINLMFLISFEMAELS